MVPSPFDTQPTDPRAVCTALKYCLLTLLGKTMPNPFESERLVFRIFRRSRIEDLHWFNTEIASDYVTRLMSSADRLIQPFTSAEHEQQDKTISEDALLSVIICRKVTDIPLGQPLGQPLETRIGIMQLTGEAIAVTTRHNRKTRLLVQICRCARGRKFGFEAVNWALNWAFGTAGMHRVRGSILHFLQLCPNQMAQVAVSTMGYNVRVLAWFKRIGFVEEGREREGCWHSGEWHDIVTLGVLEGEWKALKDGTKQRGTETMADDAEGIMDGSVMRDVHL